MVPDQSEAVTHTAISAPVELHCQCVGVLDSHEADSIINPIDVLVPGWLGDVALQRWMGGRIGGRKERGQQRVRDVSSAEERGRDTWF